jgi:Transposase IS4
VDYVCAVVIPAINKEIEGPKAMFGEFLKWLGCWFMMGTITGSQHHQFWNLSDVTLTSGATFRLKHIISGNPFINILKAISYSDQKEPPYCDQFHLIRQLVDAWNDSI